MKPMGLTISVIFQASSLNYGESIGNVASLKKISRGKGDQYTYISRQALRYNIINQMGVDNTPIGLDGSVLQFDKEAKIDKYPEIDLFGYMKTSKDSKIRSAIARLSNAVSLETFKGDVDFLTNKGLLDRYKKDNKKDGGNISQSEIHSSFYTYTLAVDLDRVGIDENDNIEIENSEKAKRVNSLLDSIRYLYRDIKGRREDLSPIFIIGGVYNIKNPIFMNAIGVEENRLNVNRIEDKISKEIEKDTISALVKGIFENDEEIENSLKSKNMNEFFEELKNKVSDYYEGN